MEKAILMPFVSLITAISKPIATLLQNGHNHFHKKRSFGKKSR
jgi:hypothetical protein